MVKILWRPDKDEITFKAIDKYRYGLQKSVSSLGLSTNCSRFFKKLPGICHKVAKKLLFVRKVAQQLCK